MSDTILYHDYIFTYWCSPALKTFSLSEQVHLPAANPAVDGKVVYVSLRGLHFNIAGKPGVFWEKREWLFVKFNQHQLTQGGGAAHWKPGCLQAGKESDSGLKCCLLLHKHLEQEHQCSGKMQAWIRLTGYTD